MAYPSGKNDVMADCVADFFIASVDAGAGDLLSHLKLQKLCYFAQGWHLALRDKVLFPDEIQAWAHGPVVILLYDRFRKMRWYPITLDKIKMDIYKHLSLKQTEFLRQIWHMYGHWSAKQLEHETHQHRAWKEAYGDRPLGQRCEEVITPDAMKAEFKAML